MFLNRTKKGYPMSERDKRLLSKLLDRCLSQGSHKENLVLMHKLVLGVLLEQFTEDPPRSLCGFNDYCRQEAVKQVEKEQNIRLEGNLDD